MGCCSSLIFFTSPNDSDSRTQQNQISSNSQAVPVLDEQVLQNLKDPFPGSPKSLSNLIEPVEEQALESLDDPLPGLSRSSSKSSEPLKEETLESLNNPFPGSTQFLSELTDLIEEQALKRLKNPFTGSPQSQSVPTEFVKEQALESLSDPSPGSSQSLSESIELVEEQVLECLNNPLPGLSRSLSKSTDLIEKQVLEILKNPFPSLSQSLSESTEPDEEQTLDSLKNPLPEPQQFLSEPTELVEVQVLEVLNDPLPGLSQSLSEPTELFKEQVQESLKNPFPGSSQSLSKPTEPVEEQVLESLKNPFPGSSQSLSEPKELIEDQALESFKNSFPCSSESLSEPTEPVEEQALESLKNPIPGLSQSLSEPPELIEELFKVHSIISDHSSPQIEPSLEETLDFKEKVQQQQEQQLSKALHSLPAPLSSGSIPDAPSYAPSVSEVTSSAATLSWYGSSYDGGSQVTGYNIEAKKLPEDSWITLVKGCYSTSYKIKNLCNESQYQFRVCAVNVHGVSEPSKPSEPVTIQEQVNHEINNNFTDDEKFPPFELKKVSIETADTFSEEYDLSEELGRGGFGIVYKVKHKKTGQTRAAKVIKCIRASNKQAVRDEIDLMNSLRHPRLLQIAGAYERKRDIVMVLELISGGELFDRVIADDFDLTEKDCIFFMRQICEGLQYMHDNKILHLDLKPENILCVHENSNHIKLIDFGLSRRFDSEKSMHVLQGTPEFIAPEVINYDPISYTSDMWSVGVICYVILTGLSPFMGDSDAETLANITNGDYDFDDESFDDITQNAKDFITALLVKKKEERLTATSCLKHIWLNQNEDSATKVLSTDKLKKFTLKRKWQKTGLAIKAVGRIAIHTTYTSPPVSAIESNYPPVSSPPSSPLPTTSSAPHSPTTPTSSPSFTTVSSIVSPD